MNVRKKLSELILSPEFRDFDAKVRKNENNIFHVLGLDDYEIRHSNMLAHLLKPNRPHGFDHKILEELLIRLSQANMLKTTDNIENGRKLDILDILDIDYTCTVVEREVSTSKKKTKTEDGQRKKNYIDILIKLFLKDDADNERPIVICIENKIWSVDHGEQLQNYYKYVEETYENAYSRTYIYLTPDGDEPSEENRSTWGTLDYGVILESIKKVFGEYDPMNDVLPQEVRILTSNYLELLEKKISVDEELDEACATLCEAPENEEIMAFFFSRSKNWDKADVEHRETFIREYDQSFDRFKKFWNETKGDYQKKIHGWFEAYVKEHPEIKPESRKKKFGASIHFSTAKLESIFQPIRYYINLSNVVSLGVSFNELNPEVLSDKKERFREHTGWSRKAVQSSSSRPQWGGGVLLKASECADNPEQCTRETITEETFTKMLDKALAWENTWPRK